MSRASRRRASPSTARLRRLLRERFGLEHFRPGQEAVIRNVIAGVDTLAVMPTGAGKSLCYQLPGLLLPGTTVVVSPLIALMNDQADKLDHAGVETARGNSTLKRSESGETLERIARQGSEMVFVTPEQLQTAAVMERLANNAIDVFVIDEAHCISDWGHDFRPAYLELGNALKQLGDPPVLALTATASDRVVQDIRRQLARPEMALINGSMHRPNLQLGVTQVTHEAEKHNALERLLMQVRGTRIVYCATVKAAEALHERLVRVGHPAVLYHGRLSVQARNQSQQRFMHEEQVVMVATNAFGLGIDKPDVRAVIHYQMPASLEAYYQEAGRAGRDGERARCQLLFDHSDRRIQKFFLANRYPTAEDMAAVWGVLQRLPEGQKLTSLELAARAPTVARTKLRVALKALQDAGFVSAERTRYAARPQAFDAPQAEQVAAAYKRRADVDHIKLEQLIAYAFSARCRWRNLLDYFGETPEWDRCGICDNCRHPVEVRHTFPEVPSGAKETASEQSGNFALGQRVGVPRYGEGTVTETTAESVTVAFPDGKRRRFIRSALTSVRHG